MSDLLGSSGIPILRALANGETDAKNLASLGDDRLRCPEDQLVEALTGRSYTMQGQMLALQLERLRLLDGQILRLNSLIAQAMTPHQDTVMRLAEVPGRGIDSAQQVIAEVCVTASTFPSSAEFTSWVRTCPRKEESAKEDSTSRSAIGNKYKRRVLSRADHAAARSKCTRFEAVFRRLLPPLGYRSGAWAIAHRLCRLIWKSLHEGTVSNSGRQADIAASLLLS